jgi:hypothetical protein
MTKITFALTAALLAGTTLTQAANARGIRVGFGFPLGSFVAHPTQSYAEDGYGYGRHCDRKRYVRRSYHADAAPARKVKRHRKIDVAETKHAAYSVIKAVKLESKLENNPATTTEIAKTNSNTSDGNSSTPPTTTASITPAATETSKTETVAAVAKTSTDEKADLNTATTAAKQICRRYSAAIAALVDVPCNE